MELIHQFGGVNDVIVFTSFILLFILVNTTINNKIIRLIISLFVSLFLCAQLFSLYSTQKFIGYQFYLHMNLKGIDGMQDLFVFQISALFIVFIILTLINFYSRVFWQRFKSSIERIPFIKIACFLSLALVIFFKGDFIKDSKTLAPIVMSYTANDFDDVLNKNGMSSYIMPNEIKCKPGKNIIVISMESVERAFLNGKYANSTPHLNKLKQSLNYLNMDQNGGSEWTSGSLYTYLTGFPAYFGVYGNDIFQTAHHSNISSISHVLDKANYQTTYINGNTDFSGTRQMLNLFQFNKILDTKTVPKSGNETHYGLRDKELFDIAKLEITAYQKSDQPFALFISTTDTHFPKGVYDKRMESVVSKKNTQLEFTVASLDYMIGDFVRFLNENNILENTSIFIFPDHLKMGDPTMFSDSAERGLYVITNSNIEKFSGKEICQIDLPKIILDGANIDHNLKFLTDFIQDNKKSHITKNVLKITEINTNGILNSNVPKVNLSKISENYEAYKKDTLRFIAHAGGVIDNKTYTNSLEALNLNYEKGFRQFELDIIETSDKKYVAAHDWEHWKKITGNNDTIPITLKKFLDTKIYDKYTPLDIKAINKWFNEHKDAILVTDKINKPVEFSALFTDKSRLIMELFDEEALADGLKCNILSAMPTQSLVQNVKIEDVKKLALRGVKNVAISRRIILKNKSLLAELKKNNIKPFVFQINFDPGINEDYVLKYELDYVYGIYADRWDFSE